MVIWWWSTTLSWFHPLHGPCLCWSSYWYAVVEDDIWWHIFGASNPSQWFNQCEYYIYICLYMYREIVISILYHISISSEKACVGMWWIIECCSLTHLAMSTIDQGGPLAVTREVNKLQLKGWNNPSYPCLRPFIGVIYVYNIYVIPFMTSRGIL